MHNNNDNKNLWWLLLWSSLCASWVYDVYVLRKYHDNMIAGWMDNDDPYDCYIVRLNWEIVY